MREVLVFPFGHLDENMLALPVKRLRQFSMIELVRQLAYDTIGW